MSDQEASKSLYVSVGDNVIDAEEAPADKPRTPRRRMTPIYDDYQTAVSMIRSGTTGLALPATPGFEKTASMPVAETLNMSKQANRRLSYSMTDVHRGLADSFDDMQTTLPAQDANAKESHSTLSQSADEKRASISVFPLRGRDSDDENERLIAQGEYLSEEQTDNPAGIDLNDHDIPLREIELAQVCSRTRGDPILSQAIHASSADLDYAEDMNMSKPAADTSSTTRISGNAPTETSTVGQIVDQYGSVSVSDPKQPPYFHDTAPTDVHPEYIADDKANGLMGLNRQGSNRPSFDAGPPPSWPLPAPPELPPRSTARHDSSGIVSSQGTYGNTSTILNTKLLDTSMPNTSCPGLYFPSSPPYSTQLKHSKSEDHLISGHNNVCGAGTGHGNKVDHARLSHVSEESSYRSSDDSGWMAAVGYLGRVPGTGDEDLVGVGHRGNAGRAAVGLVPNHEMDDLKKSTWWSPGHRRTDNIFQPSELSVGTLKKSGGMDLAARRRYRSLDKVLAGPVDIDSDTIDVVDDGDWETIHESQSRSNIQAHDISKDEDAMTEFAKLSSFGSLSLEKAPVSAWDPLSTKAPGFDQSDTLAGLVKSKKEATTNKKAQGLGKAGANDKKALNGAAQLQDASLLPASAFAAGGSPEDSELTPPKLSPVNSFRPAEQIPYRHPTPFDPLHNNPFAAGRPALGPLIKRPSTLSLDTMPNNQDSMIKQTARSTSSEAGNSLGAASVESRDEYNRCILREIERYDPDRPRVTSIYPNARLTVDRRFRLGRFDSQVIRVQRKVAAWLRLIAMVTYPVGGFRLLNAMANGTPYANDAMLQVSRAFGMRVVAQIREDDIAIAKKLEGWMLAGVFALFAAIIVILAWAVNSKY